MTTNRKKPSAISYELSANLIELCLIFLIVFTPLAYGSVHPWAIATFQIIAALMALIWLLKMLRSGTLEFIRNPLNLFIFLFIFYVSLQLFFSNYQLSAISYQLPNSLYSWATKTELLKIISYVLIFLVTLNTIKTRQQITRILSVIITVGFFMSIFYLMRYFGAKAPQGIINSDHFSGYLGMIIPLTLGLLFVGNTTVIARSATSPVIASKRSSSAIASEHSSSVIARSPDEVGTTKQSHPRTLLFFTILVMSAALFFTMSRGGMFSFIIALLFMAGLILTRKSIKKKGWIISAVAIFIVLTIVWLGATPVVERILSIKAEIASRYFGGRFPIWQGTINIIKDYPIFGTGLGTFNYIFPKYQPAQIMAKHYAYAHSDILEFLCEVGMPFFFLSVVCGLWTVVWLFRRFDRRHDPWVIGLSIGLFGSLSAIFIHSFADFNLHIPSNAILLTLILALTPIILNLKKDKFGERVVFAKRYFRLTKGTVPEGRNNRDCPRRGLSLNFIFYLVIITLFFTFTIACVRPALADYYFQQATSSAKGLSPQELALSEAKGVPKASIPEGGTRHCEERSDEAISYKIHNTKLAITLDPTNATYRYHLGKLYSNLSPMSYGPSAMSHQLSAYKKAVDLNPTNSKYHQSLAWTYGQLASVILTSSVISTSSVIPAKAGIQSSSLRGVPTKSRRRSNLNSDEYNKEAISEFELAISLEPNNPYRHRAYAIWLFNHPTEENIEKGISKYRKAIELEPSLIGEVLTRYYRYQKDYKKLADVLPGTIEGKDYKILCFLIKEKGLKFAVDFAEKFLKTYPHNAAIHFWIADRSFYDRDFPWEFTEKHYAIVFKNAPDNAYYRMWHGIHLCHRREYEKALKDLEMAMEMGLDPKNEKRAKEYLEKCKSTIQSESLKGN